MELMTACLGVTPAEPGREPPTSGRAAGAALVISDDELQHEPVALVIGALECADALLVRIQTDGLVAGVNVHLSDAYRQARHFLSGSEGEYSADVYRIASGGSTGARYVLTTFSVLGRGPSTGRFSRCKALSRIVRLVSSSTQPSLSPVGARGRI